MTTIQAYLETYQADGIGMTDFALESAGSFIEVIMNAWIKWQFVTLK